VPAAAQGQAAAWDRAGDGASPGRADRKVFSTEVALDFNKEQMKLSYSKFNF